MAIRPTPGRSLVTGRAVRDIVRTATIGSYGVTGFAGGPVARLIERLGLGQPGLAVRVDDGIEIELDLTVALGVPVAEVARQVDSAIRYAVRRALDRDVGRIAIHVDGL
ncbi:MAG: Asp23/Gls24 family envelope stress response protein, partial [Candidatus Limnocylindrales bacterium]